MDVANLSFLVIHSRVAKTLKEIMLHALFPHRIEHPNRWTERTSPFIYFGQYIILEAHFTQLAIRCQNVGCEQVKEQGATRLPKAAGQSKAVYMA
jgi:hypothetical protein